jgi:hypothetical protein
MKNIIWNIKNFFRNLRRSCRWFKRMWNNYDFGDDYLIEVIVWKMKDMLYQFDVIDKNIVDLRDQQLYKDNGYDGDLIKSLEECIEIGERLLEDDYVIYPDIVKDWKSKHSFSEKMPDEIRTLAIKAFTESFNRQIEDNNKFFDIIKKHHWGWSS